VYLTNRRLNVSDDEKWETPKWMKTIEAAEFLGVLPNWLERRRMKGTQLHGPDYTRLGGVCVYLKEDLIRYLKEQRVVPEGRRVESGAD
jgi:hypothetical protein